MSDDVEVAPCDYGDCAEEWTFSCHHGHWCGAHVTAHQREDEFCRKALAQAMMRLYRQFFEPLFRLRDEMLPVTCVVLEGIALFGVGFCEELRASIRALYESEGEPYGSDEEAMWRWLEERLEHAEN